MLTNIRNEEITDFELDKKRKNIKQNEIDLNKNDHINDIQSNFDENFQDINKKYESFRDG